MNRKQIIQTENAPSAIGAYSQAVKINSTDGSTVYISGQIPLDPIKMQVVEGNFNQRVLQVLNNLQAIAVAAGGTINDAVKLNVFLTDLTDFDTVNKAMDCFLEQPFPARSAVQVAALPKGVDVEIDAVLHF